MRLAGVRYLGLARPATISEMPMMRTTLSDTIAARLLARDGISAIWQLHLRAAASHRRGNWISAFALIGVAEAAERLWTQGAR